MNPATDGFDEIIRGGRRLADEGMSPGSSGNISVLVGDRMILSGSGTRLGALSPESLAVLDPQGTRVDGAKPSKEAPLHAAMYRRNPAHRAVVHLHSPHAVAWACSAPWSERSAIPPLTPYFVMRVGQTPLIPFRVPGDPELGRLVLEPGFRFHAALLANHGQIVSAENMDAAIDAAIEVEEACRIALLTQGGSPRLLDEAAVRDLAAQWGTPWDG